MRRNFAVNRLNGVSFSLADSLFIGVSMSDPCRYQQPVKHEKMTSHVEDQPGGIHIPPAQHVADLSPAPSLIDAPPPRFREP